MTAPHPQMFFFAWGRVCRGGLISHQIHQTPSREPPNPPFLVGWWIINPPSQTPFPPTQNICGRDGRAWDVRGEAVTLVRVRGGAVTALPANVLDRGSGQLGKWLNDPLTHFSPASHPLRKWISGLLNHFPKRAAPQCKTFGDGAAR
jgi:hypothetical protein